MYSIYKYLMNLVSDIIELQIIIHVTLTNPEVYNYFLAKEMISTSSFFPLKLG